MGQVIKVLITVLLTILGTAMSLHGLYFVVVALFGFKRAPSATIYFPKKRFAVLVAARNEEAVIGRLLESLHGQEYPMELFDVFVGPNNCTDNTRGIAEKLGAYVIEPKGPISSKGQMLGQMCDVILAAGAYDAICVVDADNLVHPGFLQKMNDALCGGAKVAQGFRDSKNPADTAVSTCFSISYWMLDQFYNAGREALGLSSLVNGTGFVVSTEVLDAMGGLHTQTVTEDYELTASFVLDGCTVRYVRDAIVYDEEPLTFRQSWSQRRRWATGGFQNIPLSLRRLLRGGIKGRSRACLDVAITYLTPLVQLVSLAIGLPTGIWGLYRLFTAGALPAAQLLILLLATLLLVYLACTLLAAFVVHQNSKSLRGKLPGILFFAFFLLSWIPITLVSFFKKKTQWIAIPHTRAIKYTELAKEE